MISKKLLFFSLLFFVIYFASAFELKITDKAVEGYVHGEHNRNEAYSGYASAIGELELDDLFLLRGGLALGKSGSSSEFRFFINTGASPFTGKFTKPIFFSIKWLYTGLIDYELDEHSILPYVTYSNNRAGILLGLNLRYSSFFNKPPEFEGILTYLVFFNFINSETLRIGVKLGTYNDFYAKDIGVAALSVDADVRIDENWRIINRLEYMQNGIEEFAFNFYGFSWTGGVRYSW